MKSNNDKLTELYLFEQNLESYYEENLKDYVDAFEKQRIDNLETIKVRTKKSSIILLAIIIFTGLINFSPFSDIYHNLIEKIDHLMLIYNNWYKDQNSLLRVILPSHIFWWHVIKLWMIDVGVFIYLSIQCMLPIFFYRSLSIKEYCLMPLISFANVCNFYEENIFLQTDYSNAIVFPTFDQAIFSEGCYVLQHQNVEVKISELELLIDNETIKRNVFKGMIVACDFKDFNLNINGKNVIIVNEDDFLKARFKEEDLYCEIDQKTSYYSNDKESARNQKILDLMKVIQLNSDIINQHNEQKKQNFIHHHLVSIFEKLNNSSPTSIADKTIQCAILDNVIYFMIPFNRDLFQNSSLFIQPSFDDDIHLVLSSINMIKKSIDFIKDVN